MSVVVVGRGAAAGGDDAFPVFMLLSPEDPEVAVAVMGAGAAGSLTDAGDVRCISSATDDKGNKWAESDVSGATS